MASQSRPAAVAFAGALMVLALVVGCGERTPAPPAEVLLSAPVAPESLLQPSEVNGCDSLTAETSPSREVVVEFGGDSDPLYRPRCLSLVVGDAVKFAGDFALHPLSGGSVIDGVPAWDARSPLPYVNAGTEATFRAHRAGVYPFYCRVHGALGMSGVVYVR